MANSETELRIDAVNAELTALTAQTGCLVMLYSPMSWMAMCSASWLRSIMVQIHKKQDVCKNQDVNIMRPPPTSCQDVGGGPKQLPPTLGFSIIVPDHGPWAEAPWLRAIAHGHE